MDKKQYILKLMFSSTNTMDAAKTIARQLVEKKMAACISIIPEVTSIYHWQGKVAEEKEVLLFIKTHHQKFDALLKTLKEVHEYDVPELVAWDTAEVFEGYGAWVYEATSKMPNPRHKKTPV